MLIDVCYFVMLFPEEGWQYINRKFGQFCSITLLEELYYHAIYNHIVIYNFTAKWFCSFCFVLFGNYYDFSKYDTIYTEKCLLSIFCVDISFEP